MITPYKQALDRMSQAQSWRDGLTIQEQETIRRALMIADAVYGEELSKCRPIRDRVNGVYSSESYRVDGWNNCLEHLKKIGSGE